MVDDIGSKCGRLAKKLVKVWTVFCHILDKTSCVVLFVFNVFLWLFLSRETNTISFWDFDICFVVLSFTEICNKCVPHECFLFAKKLVKVWTVFCHILDKTSCVVLFVFNVFLWLFLSRETNTISFWDFDICFVVLSFTEICNKCVPHECFCIRCNIISKGKPAVCVESGLCM